MATLSNQNLFLLEFLVDKLELDRKCECDTPPGQNCVSFQFLDNPPLEVCDADFGPNKQSGQGNGNIKSGKSCLFSLTPEQANEAMSLFDVPVRVFKKMQPGWLPEVVETGTTTISICELFTEVGEAAQQSEDDTPVSKTQKDDYPITSPEGNLIGKIGVYIRMTCFGKVIVTQFQMNLDDKSVLFKDNEGKSLYRYKKTKKGELDGKPGGGGPNKSSPNFNPDCPATPCNTPQRANSLKFGNNSPQVNLNCPDIPCAQFLANGMNMPGNPPGGMNMPPPNNGCPCGQFPGGGQFGDPAGVFPAGMPGQSPFPPPPQTPCVECGLLPPCAECGQIPAPCLNPMLGAGGMPMNFPQVDNGAPCNECCFLPFAPCAPQNSNRYNARPPTALNEEGNYQEIGAQMGGNALKIRVHKDKNKIEEVSSSEACSCGAGNNDPKKKKNGENAQQFAMRPGVQQGDQNTPFSFKMGGCGQAAKDNVVVNAPVGTTQDGMQYTELSDPDKEVFVLRIGKKSEGTDKKNNLELELCTPKGPDLKPKPKKETRDTQYDERDAGSNGSGGGNGKKGKGGKGKGGKGKGGKGKKGKK